MESEMKIGTTKSFTKFANKDPWKNVPFVEPEAPADGLMALYVVCILLVAGYFAYIVWGVS